MNKNFVISIAIVCASGLIAYAMYLHQQNLPAKPHLNVNANGGFLSWKYSVSIEGDGATAEVAGLHASNIAALEARDRELKK